MKTCPKCKTLLEDFVEFCPICGTDTPLSQSKTFQQLPPPQDLIERQRRIELKEQRRIEKERRREEKRREKMEKRMQKARMRKMQYQKPPQFLIQQKQEIKQVEEKKCKICGNSLIFMSQLKKWYCKNCKKFE